jgi:YkoP-like protein
MRVIIRSFDAWLRRTSGVFEFSADPKCLFRLRRTRAPHDLQLPDVEVPASAPVLELHLWNEHMLPIPSEGPDVIWAMQLRKMVIESLHAVGQQFRRDPRLSSVQAVGGVTVLLFTGPHTGAERLFSRLGFRVFPYHNPLGRFGEFWENLYTWGLMWTFNAASLRRRQLLRLRRTEVWLSAREFLRRYGMDAVREGDALAQPPVPTGRSGQVKS